MFNNIDDIQCGARGCIEKSVSTKVSIKNLPGSHIHSSAVRPASNSRIPLNDISILSNLSVTVITLVVDVTYNII